jgi:hypothetical protein
MDGVTVPWFQRDIHAYSNDAAGTLESSRSVIGKQSDYEGEVAHVRSGVKRGRTSGGVSASTWSTIQGWPYLKRASENWGEWGAAIGEYHGNLYASPADDSSFPRLKRREV